jgi:hypothetical protein
MPPVWNGSLAERDELLRILSHNCACQYDSSGARSGLCTVHAAVINSQRFLDGLLFARRIVERLISEEWLVDASGLRDDKLLRLMRY